MRGWLIPPPDEGTEPDSIAPRTSRTFLLPLVEQPRTDSYDATVELFVNMLDHPLIDDPAVINDAATVTEIFVINGVNPPSTQP